jgi:hypothetical protein
MNSTWRLNSFSFRYFGENHGGFGYYSAARFREVKVYVRLLALDGFRASGESFSAQPQISGNIICATWCAVR